MCCAYCGQMQYFASQMQYFASTFEISGWSSDAWSVGYDAWWNGWPDAWGHARTSIAWWPSGGSSIASPLHGHCTAGVSCAC